MCNIKKISTLSLLFLLALWTQALAEVRPAQIKDVSLRRLESSPSTLLVSFTFNQQVSPDRVRFLLDIDGAATGEAATGADFMLEGTTWFSLPEGESGWAWSPISQVPVITDGNTLHFLIENAPTFKTGAWIAQRTTEKWEVAESFPGETMKKVIARTLPVLPLKELNSSPSEAALDIRKVEFYRLKPAGLAVRVYTAAIPDPGRVRILIDLDGVGNGEPSSGGADMMIEGVQSFVYANDGKPWSWTPEGAVGILQRDRSIIYLLPDLSLPETFEWVVETTRADWSRADRYPVVEKMPAVRDELEERDFKVKPKAIDLSALLQHLPESLSPGFEDWLNKEEWTLDEGGEANVPTWHPSSLDAPLPLAFSLMDVVSGAQEVLEPTQMFQSGLRRRWSGENLGLVWDLIAVPNAHGDLQLTGRFRAESNRCIRVGIGCSLDLLGWIWHDDFRFRRIIEESGEPYRNTGAFPFGYSGEQSLYPFAVISNDDTTLCVETDPTEPRVCQVYAESERSFFGMYYDLGLSPDTKKFPGAATFRCTLRSSSTGGPESFRRALSDFYTNYPDYLNSRTEKAGLWMPFSDMSKVPNAEDFGFAFFEKGGALGQDVDYAKEHSILTLVYTEPWLHWLTLSAEMGWNDAAALKQMKFLSGRGDAQANHFSSASLLGASRTPEGKIRMKFLNTPWSSGARMEVNTDPELATSKRRPVNRAMAEWKYIQEVLKDERVDGIYLDSMSAMQEITYDARALAVSDYPCTFDLQTRRPGLAAPFANIKFTAALSAYLKEQGKYLMGNFPCWNHPFFMPYIDIPGEETTWYAGHQYQPMEARQLNFRRAISGKKPFGFLQATFFDDFKGDLMERYFKDCLFYGFQPSFFSHDAANNPYWENSTWLERDRHFFKTYMPMIQRVALAGWQAQRAISSSSDLIWIEQYGTLEDRRWFLTLRNESASLQTASLTLKEGHEDWICYDPFSGQVDTLPLNAETPGSVNVALRAGAIGLRIFCHPSRLTEEIEFLKKWQADHGVAAVSAGNLASIQRERKAGLWCQTIYPIPSLVSGENTLNIEIKNQNASPLTFGKGGGNVTLDPSSSQILSGEIGSLSGVYRSVDRAESTPLTVTRKVNVGDEELQIVRSWLPLYAQPVEIVHGPTRLFALNPSTVLDLTLHNHSSQSIALNIEWEGNAGRGTLAGELGPLETRTETLEVALSGFEKDKVQVSALIGEEVIFEEVFEITRLPKGASMARDSQVHISVDSTFGGYALNALTDGIVGSSDLSWNEAAWASEETPLSHWIRLVFPEPKAVSRVELHWNVENGVTNSSRKGEVRGWTLDGEQIILGSYEALEATPETIISFETIDVKKIEIFQPVGAGSVERPNLIWLREVGVY